MTIINYGLGNIRAFVNIYESINVPVEVASTPEEMKRAEKIILPGVGAFDWAMTKLNNSGLRDILDELVLEKLVPILGVCVGMQMMALRSEEGALPGLEWVDAEVVRFNALQIDDSPLPHMGWNDIDPVSHDCLFRGIEVPRFYFLHSFCVVPNHTDLMLATTNYGMEFTSAWRNGNIFGTQFHPEKSHRWGIELLKNFSDL